MRDNDTWLSGALERGGYSRRDFLGFCAAVAAYFSLPKEAAAQLAHAVQAAPKPTVLWFEFQDCAGDTESLLRATSPTIAGVILDTISLDYHETIMAAAGARASQALEQSKSAHRGQYLVVIEGAIPTGAGGVYCTVGGKTALQIAREACAHAAATIAVGTCAAFGGLPAARPNPTGAQSVADAIPGLTNLINLPACPVNVENLTALIVYYLGFGHWPPLDSNRRPLFAHGTSIHDNCERRAHFDAGQYVEQWGDEGHRQGYCLYKVGCKGPVTFQNCPTVRWNGGTNWAVGCGHPCIGCAEPGFWDTMTPFYRHLRGIPGFGVASQIDTIGLAAVAGVATAFTGHGIVNLVKRTAERRAERAAAAAKDANASVATHTASPVGAAAETTAKPETVPAENTASTVAPDAEGSRKETKTP